jgi:hypothetical protein
VVLQYKYVNGTTYETGNSACGIDDGNGGYNRNYVVPEADDTIAVVCFNECINCALPAFADVTFSVNMSNQTISPLGVFLAGSFNGFSATTDSMIAVGNGVYEITLSLDTTLSVQYKFVNGSSYENGNVSCGVPDGINGYNRVYNVMGTNSVIPTVCFNECANCVPVGLINNLAEGVEIYPNPASDVMFVNLISFEQQTQYQIVDQIGATIAIGTMLSNNESIDLSTFEDGVYFIKIANSKQTLVKRFIKN